MSDSCPPLVLTRFDAVLFDLDGVLTATAKVHAAAWKRMFDLFLRRWADDHGEQFVPFDITTDYEQYVDGKPRYDGVQSFIESRGIELPYGEPDGEPGYDTICGLGNHKDVLINEALAAGGIEAYEGSVALVRQLRDKGIKTAVVSSSHNCQAVLRATGIDDLFDARVDGVVADDMVLPGKPAPHTFLKAAEMLGVEPSRAVVVEDALSGVQAGRAGGFGLVIGVDRKNVGDALRANGADVVVKDLDELLDR
jgi:beta-phosphoglucomutase family hydrolase